MTLFSRVSVAAGSSVEVVSSVGVVSVVSLVTVALTDLFWVRMGLLAAGLGVCALWAVRHRDQVMRLIAVFRKKSA